jgi:hypothetical protein
VISATGQSPQQTSVMASPGVTTVVLPAAMGKGLYFLEVQTADGSRQLRRFVVQR